jgi:general stress protein YciG
MPTANPQKTTSSTADSGPPPKARRGFAVMDPARVREIARRGGKAAHEKGRAHTFTPEEAREAGRKGGLASHRPRDEES